MKSSTRTTVSFVLATAATLCLSGIASAKSDDSDYRKVEVSYSDLDLAQVAHAQRLYARIASAARKACKQNGILFQSSVFNECVGSAVDGAVHSVSNENLTAVHLRSAGSRAVAAAGR
jgi:UrcA family protein